MPLQVANGVNNTLGFLPINAPHHQLAPRLALPPQQEANSNGPLVAGSLAMALASGGIVLGVLLLVLLYRYSTSTATTENDNRLEEGHELPTQSRGRSRTRNSSHSGNGRGTLFDQSARQVRANSAEIDLEAQEDSEWENLFEL